MGKKLCLIYNTAPHYREAVFRAIDAEYDCDWYFGETKTDIKEMDTSLLKHVQYYKTYGNPNILYWKCGILKLLFRKDYQNFFILAEVRSVTDYLFLLIASFFRKNIYIWTHGWYGKEKGIIAKLKLWQFKKVTGAFVYNERAKKKLIEQGIPEKTLFVIYNSLDYDTQKILRESIHHSDVYKNYFQNDKPIIIFIGRLTKVKKLDMVIDAVDALRGRGEYYNLVFVGDGIDAARLKNRVIDLKLGSQVWFYGACYDEKTNAELLYNADICVSPGNVGLSAMHSLMFGCPVITHNSFEWQMPEFEAVQKGETGDFFIKDNVKDLIDVISRWFAEKSDKRDEVRKACFEVIDTKWNPSYQMEVIKNNLRLV